MPADDLPTEEQLADDLAKVARNGVGNSLPNMQTAADIPYLWAAASELADDPDDDLPLLIAKLVVPAVNDIQPLSNRLAVADILWIDLEAADGLRDGEAPALGGHGNRYAQAASRLNSTELQVKNNLRRPMLEKVAERILARLKKHHDEVAPSSVHIKRGGSPDATTPTPEADNQTHPNPRFVAAVGFTLIMLGAIWLIGLALGAPLVRSSVGTYLLNLKPVAKIANLPQSSTCDAFVGAAGRSKIASTAHPVPLTIHHFRPIGRHLPPACDNFATLLHHAVQHRTT